MKPSKRVRKSIYFSVYAVCIYRIVPLPNASSKAKMDNRNPSTGKVHIQNHAVVDKSPFFLFKPFRVMVLSDKRPIAILRADVILETQNNEAKDILERFLQHIHSVLLEDFYGLSQLLWGSGYHPDLMAIKLRVERLVKTIVHEDLVRDVLVQKVFLKPLPKTRDNISM